MLPDIRSKAIAWRTMKSEPTSFVDPELMTIYEQALHKGRQEGRQQTSVNLLAKQLTLKFGELPSEYEARLHAATPEDVDRYVERILTADTIAAVFADPA